MTTAAPLTFTGETAAPSPASPNPYRDPRPWYTVIIGGRTIAAPLVGYGGMKIEDEWKVDKSKSTSGHVPKFAGTKGRTEIMLTFAAADADDFDDIGDLFTLMAPAPGAYSSTPPTTTTTGQTSGVGSVASGATVGTVDPNTGKAVDPDNAFGAASSQVTQDPDPGPRPPTLPIVNAVCAWHGVFAVARRSIELEWVKDDNSWLCHLGLIQDEPPVAIAAGAMQGPAFAPLPDATGGTSSDDNAGAAEAAT
ncbi:MAG TPA: hypothetical protein VLT47_14435 [Anaeromyxobacteraceae bacterium]|nr:hypothetical protein [Anaeromyxobacteraceae bacterium]